MSTDTTTTDSGTDTPTDVDRLDALAGEAIKALRTARKDCRMGQADCEGMLAVVNRTIAADAVRVGVFHAIFAAVEWAQDRTAADCEYCPDGPCGQLLDRARACILAAEDSHFAALQKILDAANSIVGPRDEVDQCNDPLDALKAMRDRLAKVVESFKPSAPNAIGGDDIPF